MAKAIFLGSFNPPHKGHYNCIKSFIDSGFMEEHNIDKIHIIPCYQNPNKQKYTVPFYYRYKMCCEMFRDLILDDKVLIDDIENNIEPQYTFDLIKYFKSNEDGFIKDDFYWIITTETLKEIIDGKWFRWPDLLDDNKFIVMYEDNGQKPICDINMYPIPLKENVSIHSTQIREKVKNGESIINETNDNVQKYILEKDLYNKICYT